jgi:Mrp family chromosome partitioning ATPase
MSRNFELLTEMEREMSGREPVLPNKAADSIYRPAESTPRDLSSVDQQVRQLVQRVFLSMNGSAPRQVVFFGADGAGDSSHICAAVGRGLSSGGSKSVCVVDANLRSHRLSSMLEADAVARLVRKPATTREMCIEVGSNLWLAKLADLTGKTGDLPSVEAIRGYFHTLRNQFDYVLIDSPDVNAAGDALVLSSVADGSILVIEAHHTRRMNARTAKEKCDSAGIKLLGTVLDNRTFPIPERLYRLF